MQASMQLALVAVALAACTTIAPFSHTAYERLVQLAKREKPERSPELDAALADF